MVAVAAGTAFTFGYTEHEELLRAAGAEAVSIRSAHRHAAGIAPRHWCCPAAFPSSTPKQLSGNVALREQIRALAAHAPVHAECGGLTYLMSELDGHRMCGVLPGSATFGPRLTLGYRDAVAAADSSLYTGRSAGDRP